MTYCAPYLNSVGDRIQRRESFAIGIEHVDVHSLFLLKNSFLSINGIISQLMTILN